MAQKITLEVVVERRVAEIQALVAQEESKLSQLRVQTPGLLALSIELAEQALAIQELLGKSAAAYDAETGKGRSFLTACRTAYANTRRGLRGLRAQQERIDKSRAAAEAHYAKQAEQAEALAAICDAETLAAARALVAAADAVTA